MPITAGAGSTSGDDLPWIEGAAERTRSEADLTSLCATAGRSVAHLRKEPVGFGGLGPLVNRPA